MPRLEIEISNHHLGIVDKFMKKDMFSTVEIAFMCALENEYENEKYLLENNNLEQFRNELKKAIGGPFSTTVEFANALHKFIYPEFEGLLKKQG